MISYVKNYHFFNIEKVIFRYYIQLYTNQYYFKEITIMRRILYFLATNFAIIIVLGIFLTIITPFLPPELRSGLLGNFFFSAVFGFGGAFISLMMSKGIAKRSAGVQVITEPSNSTERWLLETVERQAKLAGKTFFVIIKSN